MKSENICKRVRKVSQPFRVNSGKNFRLKDIDPDETLEYQDEDKAKSKHALAEGIAALAELQDKLYAQGKWASFSFFRRWMQRGRTVRSSTSCRGLIRRVARSIHSRRLHRGARSRLFVALHETLPNRGQIGIFNRSYYEEVLIVRVHKEIFAKEKLPPKLMGKNVWNTVSKKSGISSAT